MGYLDRLEDIAKRDAECLVVKDREYGSSWKKRGGVGAFMMAARKWDRVEKQVGDHDYDVFAAINANPRDDGVIDDIRDLRRYLLLIEAEMCDRLAILREKPERESYSRPLEP